MYISKKICLLSSLLFLAFCTKAPATDANNNDHVPVKTDYEQFLEGKISADRKAFHVSVRQQCTTGTRDEFYMLDSSSTDEEWNKEAILHNARTCIHIPSYTVTMDKSNMDLETDAKLAFFQHKDGRLALLQEGIGEYIGTKRVLRPDLSFNVSYNAVLGFKEKGKDKESYIILPPFILEVH